MSAKPITCKAKSGALPNKGFTLVEMVASMAIMMILLVAIGSALTLSIRTTNGPGVTDQTNLLSEADAADQIADDLHVAMNFTERTSTSLTFSVPDRVSNGTPNQIRYAWDGTSGHPLTRQFSASSTTLLNGSSSVPAVSLLSNVTNFSANYLFRLMGPAPAAVDSVLATSTSGLLGSNAIYNIDANHWLCQCVFPSVPGSATSYTVKRIQLAMKMSGPPDATMFIRVTLPDIYGRPLGTVLEQQPLYEASLSSSFEYVEVPFKNLTNLNPNAGLCIVIGYTSGAATGGTALYQSSLLTLLSSAAMSWTSNGGSAWSFPSANNCLQFYLYGTVP